MEQAASFGLNGLETGQILKNMFFRELLPMPKQDGRRLRRNPTPGFWMRWKH